MNASMSLSGFSSMTLILLSSMAYGSLSSSTSFFMYSTSMLFSSPTSIRLETWKTNFLHSNFSGFLAYLSIAWGKK